MINSYFFGVSVLHMIYELLVMKQKCVIINLLQDYI